MNVVLLALMAWCGVEDHLRPPQLRLEIAVFTGDPLGSVAQGTMKALAQPSLCTMNGQSASFLFGTELPVPTAKGVKLMPTSVQLQFTATCRPDGTAKFERRSTISRRDPATGDLQTASCEGSQVVKQGEKFRVRIAADAPDSQTWVEVTVTREPRAK